MTAVAVKDSGETVTALTGEKSSAGEKVIGENSQEAIGEKPLVKNPKSLKTDKLEFSPIEYSPMGDRHFSPMRKKEFSPMTTPAKKPKLQLVNPAKSGRRGRPRNPELPPAPDKYFYWSQAGNGLKLERRKPS